MSQRLESGRIAAGAAVGSLLVLAWREVGSNRVTLITNESPTWSALVDSLGQVFRVEGVAGGQVQWFVGGNLDEMPKGIRVQLRGRETGYVLETMANDGVWLMAVTPKMLTEAVEFSVIDRTGLVSEGPVSLGRLVDWIGDGEGWHGYAPVGMSRCG